MKKIVLTTLLLALGFNSYSQDKPKLVVGIVVDQMRYDYIYRFWDDFSDNGFKKLVDEGYFFRNTNFGYMPTYTGPGHASIFTGTTPSVHGIIGNSWYDKYTQTSVYCAGDGDMKTVCNCDNHATDVLSNDGQMSPHRMLTTTIGDELQLFNTGSKVIGISLKDRGAILPAGHMGDAAYWMDSNGEWISSSYYMESLPEWMLNYQKTNTVTDYLKGKWKGKKFSYNLDSLIAQNGPNVIKSTPFGNTILKDLANEIIVQEKLGQGANTDFFSISFSSSDYVGHQYGPHAEELIDTYIRLDNDIADLLTTLEKNIGVENVLLFLTADHGVVSVPNELKKYKIPAGYFDVSEALSALKEHLTKQFGEGKWIQRYSNQQFYLNNSLIQEKNLKKQDVEIICANFLISFEGIKNTFTASQLHNNEYQNGIYALVQKGFSQKRSGDIIINLESGWIEWKSPRGTTHGSCYSYDTHVPLIFWGKSIKQGVSDEAVFIRDIAPTVCTLLGISFPNGCTGSPIQIITE